MNKIKEFICNYWWMIIAGIVVIAISPQEKLSKYIASGIVAAFFGAIIVLFNKLTAKSNEKDGDEKQKKEEVKKEKVKKDNELKKEEKNKPNIFMLLMILLVAGYVWHNKDKPISSISDGEFSEKTENALSELDNKLNQYDTNEELYANLKNQVKDDEVAGASAFDGFIMSAQIIEEYCKSTGYIPQRYISMVNSYKKTKDFEEKLIVSSIKLGATREQAIIILDKSRNLIKQQIIKSTERDYQEIKQEEPSYTKKEYCKLYDSNAKEIISYKINEIKKHMPNAYKTYFQMK